MNSSVRLRFLFASVLFVAQAIALPALLTSVAGVPAAAAQTAAQPYDQAMEYYQSARFDMAAATLETSLAGELAPPERLRALKLLTLCRLRLGNMTGARESLKQAWQIDSAWHPGADEIPVEFAGVVDQARAEFDADAHARQQTRLDEARTRLAEPAAPAGSLSRRAAMFVAGGAFLGATLVGAAVADDDWWVFPAGAGVVAFTAWTGYNRDVHRP